MRKIVLTFGLIAGAITIAMFVVTLPFHDRIDSSTAMVVGYTSMVAASLMIFFGIRRYRDTVAGGVIGFWRAMKVGALIVGVAGLAYALAWQVIFFGFMPDYLAKYNAKELERERAKGTPPAALEAKRAEMAKWETMYRNPAFNIAITFTEPLPVWLPALLISAAVLRRRRSQPMDARLEGAPAT